jgi:hypothetical protein
MSHYEKHISDYLHIIVAGDKITSEQSDKCTICGSSLVGFIASMMGDDL